MPLAPSVSMTSLLQVDLASLRPEVVVAHAHVQQYASKVVQLQPPRAISHEKLQMLFVVAQKLLRWFVDERASLERVNLQLEQELLVTLRASTATPKQQLDESGLDERAADEPLASNGTCQNRSTHNDEDSAVSTKSVALHHLVDHDDDDQASDAQQQSQCRADADQERVESEVDDAALISDDDIDVEACREDNGEATALAQRREVAVSESQPMTSASHEIELQLPLSVQPEPLPASQVFAADTHQLSIAMNESESVPAVLHAPSPSLSTSAAETRVLDALVADTPQQLTLAIPAALPRAPLEVYHEVHRAVLRLQKLMRGYLTRRRFFRMLEELVMKSCV